MQSLLASQKVIKRPHHVTCIMITDHHMQDGIALEHACMHVQFCHAFTP